MKTVFDYFLLVLVGFVTGGVIIAAAGHFGWSGRLDFQVLSQLVHQDDTGNEDTLPTFASVEKQVSQKTPRSSERTLAWLNDYPGITEELDYLEETNCSDHAMRQYASMIRNLDTSGFDEKTGRLIDADGKVVSAMAWRMVFKGMLPLRPLAYMKDEMVPDNFKHVMKGVPRKRGWKTCKFNLSPMQRIIGADRPALGRF